MAQPSESDAVADTYHVALTVIGARAMRDSMRLWMEEVPVTQQSATSMQRWYEQGVKLVMLNYTSAQVLTDAFVRLNRALNVHETIATPGYSDDDVALDDLRRQFISTVRHYAPEALNSNVEADSIPDGSSDDAPQKPSEGTQGASQKSTDTDGPQGFSSSSGGRYKPYTGNASDYDTEAPETVPSFTLEDLKAKREARRKAAQDEAELILKQVGEKRLALRQVKVTDTQEATEIHSRAGAAVALHSDRMVMNGGRSTEEDISLLDKKVVAFVRVHEPHGDTNPCGFCAMLLSRGPVYKTEASAGMGDMNSFHNGDHCRAEGVYSKEQYDTSPRFDANRKFDKLWKDMKSGKLKDYPDAKDDLAQFRRHVRDAGLVPGDPSTNRIR